jgi:8-oxo-dGTP diphosphatase
LLRWESRLVSMWDTAMVIVRAEAGRVLLVRLDYGFKFFGLPGGVVDPGETPEQAAVREALEETGLAVTVGERLAVDELVYPTGEHYRAHSFVAVAVEGAASVQDPAEISSVGWYDLADLPEPLTPSAAVVLQRLRVV